MATATRVPVIIDTDPGVDDIVAILLAIVSPEIEILAFIVTFGNTDTDASYKNILKLYQAIGKHLEEVPEDASRFPNFRPVCPPLLVRGCSMPLDGELHSAHYFHGRDGLGNISERHPELNLEDPFVQNLLKESLTAIHQDGLDSILRLIRSKPARSITYVALGPLTTLATLLHRDKETMTSLIGRFVAIGGALDVPGNTTPVAECKSLFCLYSPFNFFADPYAVKQCITSGPQSLIPLDRFLLVALDVTTPHELPFPVYKKFVDPEFSSSAEPSIAPNKSPVTHFTSSFLEKTREVMLEFGNDAMELHDIVAIWCAMCNPPIADDTPAGECVLGTGWKARQRVFDIERTGELTRGMLVVDRREDKTAYAPGYNRAQVQKLLESTLHTQDGLWESTALPAQVEVEEKPNLKAADGHSIWCVYDTPGPEALLRLLLKRVWGVSM